MDLFLEINVSLDIYFCGQVISVRVNILLWLKVLFHRRRGETRRCERRFEMFSAYFDLKLPLMAIPSSQLILITIASNRVLTRSRADVVDSEDTVFFTSSCRLTINTRLR